MTKENTKFFFCIPECSLSYLKIVQTSGMTKENTKFFFCIPECSLSYLKANEVETMPLAILLTMQNYGL